MTSTNLLGVCKTYGPIRVIQSGCFSIFILCFIAILERDGSTTGLTKRATDDG